MKKVNSKKESENETSQIMPNCEDMGEPVFITKNGYGAFSAESYERTKALTEIQKNIELSLDNYAHGQVKEAFECMGELGEKYGE